MIRDEGPYGDIEEEIRVLRGRGCGYMASFIERKLKEIENLRSAAERAMRTLSTVQNTGGNEIGDNLLEDVKMSIAILGKALK